MPEATPRISLAAAGHAAAAAKTSRPHKIRAVKAMAPRRERLIAVARAKARRAGYPVIQTADGRGHRYLNAALPRDAKTGELVADPVTAVCGRPNRCGHAYSHLMVAGEASGVCEECWVEDIADAAERLQAQGIELGWGAVALGARAGLISLSVAQRSFYF